MIQILLKQLKTIFDINRENGEIKVSTKFYLNHDKLVANFLSQKSLQNFLTN